MQINCMKKMCPVCNDLKCPWCEWGKIFIFCPHVLSNRSVSCWKSCCGSVSSKHIVMFSYLWCLRLHPKFFQLNWEWAEWFWSLRSPVFFYCNALCWRCPWKEGQCQDSLAVNNHFLLSLPFSLHFQKLIKNIYSNATGENALSKFSAGLHEELMSVMLTTVM